MTDKAPDVEEHRMYLTPFDMDHLRDGQPVFKGIGDDVMITLVAAADWDEYESLTGGSDGRDG